jgi:hypothetical protein
LAGKLRPKKYGDRVEATVVGDADKPIAHELVDQYSDCKPKWVTFIASSVFDKKYPP